MRLGVQNYIIIWFWQKLCPQAHSKPSKHSRLSGEHMGESSESCWMSIRRKVFCLHSFLKLPIKQNHWLVTINQMLSWNQQLKILTKSPSFLIHGLLTTKLPLRLLPLFLKACIGMVTPRDPQVISGWGAWPESHWTRERIACGRDPLRRHLQKSEKAG